MFQKKEFIAGVRFMLTLRWIATFILRVDRPTLIDK